MAHIGEVQEAIFQDEEVEDEEERRRRRKEEKKAKKEKRAREEKKKEEAAAGGNIGYFVMRTPSLLDNSKQDEDEYLTAHVHKPLKSEFGNTTFSENIQSRNPAQLTPSDKNSEVSIVGEVNKWREIEEVRMKDENSSDEEEEGAQFFDSLSTPSHQHQRDKSMGVLYFDLCSSLD